MGEVDRGCGLVDINRQGVRSGLPRVKGSDTNSSGENLRIAVRLKPAIPTPPYHGRPLPVARSPARTAVSRVAGRVIALQPWRSFIATRHLAALAFDAIDLIMLAAEGSR